MTLENYRVLSGVVFNSELPGFVFEAINQKPVSADKNVKALGGNKSRQ